MADLERPEINMARIKVAGIGGLGMVAMVAVLAYNMPAVRTFVLMSLAGGILIALGVIAYRRWFHVEPPHGPTLMVDQTAVIFPPSPAAPLPGGSGDRAEYLALPN